MKQISLILAIYLFGIAIVPAFAMLNCGEEEMVCRGVSSCESEQSCGGEAEQNDSTDTDCPFGICCTSCLFCFIEQERTTIIHISVHLPKLAGADQEIISAYTADCWQPPEG